MPSALDRPLALVLSGGSALGAYQAGAYAALHAAGLRPDWVSGASIGAVNGAIIAGNAPADQVAQLTAFWRPGAAGAAPDATLETWRRTLAVQTAMATGRADVFTPRMLLGGAWPFADAERPSLFDTQPLGPALARLLDFDRLNGGTLRYCAAAVDLDTGADLFFDTTRQRVGVEHIRASAALLPAFQPVEMDGRLVGDAGLSGNLPLDAVLDGLEDAQRLVVCIDLLPLSGSRPRTVTEAATRMQDLMFATQSRRAIEAWGRVFAERDAAGVRATPAVTLIHLTYADQAREVVGKAFDYSPATLRDRWEIGGRDAARVAAMLADGRIPLADAPGLHVHRFEWRGQVRG